MTVRNVLAAVAACSLALAACATPGTTGTSDAAAPTASTAASTSASPKSSPTPDPNAGIRERAIAEIAIEGGPDLPTEAFGSIWVIAPDSSEPALHRIDPDTNEVVASVAVPMRPCQGLGASTEALWVCGPSGLSRIDPSTNAISAIVEFAPADVFQRIATGAGSIWALASGSLPRDTVVRIDPVTNSITATITLGHTAGALAFGSGAVWVSSPPDDLLLRIDPATNVATTWTTGIEGAGWVAAGDSGIWVGLYGQDLATAPEGAPTVVRIDPAGGAVVAEIDAGEALGITGSVYASDDVVWVRTPDPFLVRIDPATNEIVERIDGLQGGGDVTVAFGSVWASAYDRNTIWRLRPSP